MLKVRLAVIGETLATALEFKDNRPVTEAFSRLAQDAHLRLIVAYDETKAAVEKYPAASGEPAPARAPVESATYEDDLLRLSLPVRHNGAVVGTLYVVRDMAEVRAQSESALISAGLAAVIALGLGVVFSGMLRSEEHTSELQSH